MSGSARIALVVAALEPGGVETYLLRLARGLAEAGHRVQVVAVEREGAWFETFRKRGIDVRCVHLLDSWTAAAHARRVAAALAAFDVVFLNHARLAQLALALLPDRVIAIPVVHNHDDVVYEVGCGNAFAWNVAVAVGPRVFAEVRRRMPARPVLLITNGVDLPSNEERVRLPAGSLSLLFAGRLYDPHKGVLLLPDIVRGALDAGLDVRLTLVGEGEDRPRLARAFADAGVADRVTLAGRIAPEAMGDVYRRAHVLLLPSLFEGFPLVPLEAMAHGVVPIATRLPGITDVAIEEGRSGFLVPREAPAFVERLRTLHDDRARWSAMSAAAAARIAEAFSTEAMCASYLALIDDAREERYPLHASRSTLPELDPELLESRDMHVRKVRRRLLRRVARLFP